ncbi:SlyX protein [Halopseudomonas salegens]|uniref:Protein SlyX homolog n=2 Tax=Halopseudomonas salegens TaxID=1434072 RepID=A0A1H2G1W1_9GAMM|nr:SlyX protein [Halopseudomonas salegens]
MIDLEQRLATLETRLAFQDDTIDALNTEVAQLQERLLRMQRALELVARRQTDLAANLPADASEEPPPPHY